MVNSHGIGIQSKNGDIKMKSTDHIKPNEVGCYNCTRWRTGSKRCNTCVNFSQFKNIDTLNTSLNTLQSSLDKMSEYEDVMDKFVEGTNKWQQAAQNLSQEIETLLQLYPELEQYVDQGADGLYHFKGKTKEEQEENNEDSEEDLANSKNLSSSISCTNISNI